MKLDARGRPRKKIANKTTHKTAPSIAQLNKTTLVPPPGAGGSAGNGVAANSEEAFGKESADDNAAQSSRPATAKRPKTPEPPKPLPEVQQEIDRKRAELEKRKLEVITAIYLLVHLYLLFAFCTFTVKIYY